jgi:beta-phosphoglucomutase
MRWLANFDLFLFDFDGLLVNTEQIHFQAYGNMLKNRGFDLDWSFGDYCLISHTSNEGLKEAIYSKFPALLEIQPRWEVLYKEKKECYKDLLKNAKVPLMPGVEKVLNELRKLDKRCCVVTNSLLEQIELIKIKHPVLQGNLHWITREDYLQPKPNPESYLRAIQLYGKKSDRIIGFEDTIKGIDALSKTPATCVLVCPSHHPQMGVVTEKNFFHFETFEKIAENFAFGMDRKVLR